MKHNVIIARYGEVALKSPKVRSRFEKRLVKNIKASIDAKVEREQGVFYIFPEDYDEALNKLKKIFGIVSFSPAISTKSTFEDIQETLEEYLDVLVDEGYISSETPFAIRCRRVGKHDFSSQEMAAFCGSVVVKKISAPVDLTNPEATIYVEIRDDKAFLYTEKIPGPGGLPLGTQGKVVCLLSSGIDSPVATYLMMKRGCEVVALHFDGRPFASEEPKEVFDMLVDKLQEYSSGAPIKTRVAKYGDYLQKCKKDAPEKMTCVLCKSGMYKIASMLAKKIGADAIVDGSSVGQVASQTLPNILATRYGVDVPILSPLIGLDKVEIQRIAKEIGTLKISEIDDGGCHAVPRHPETNAKMKEVLEVQKAINQDEAILKTFETIEH